MRQFLILIFSIACTSIGSGFSLAQSSPAIQALKDKKCAVIPSRCAGAWKLVERSTVALCMPSSFRIDDFVSMDQSYLKITGDDLEITVFFWYPHSDADE